MIHRWPGCPPPLLGPHLRRQVDDEMEPAPEITACRIKEQDEKDGKLCKPILKVAEDSGFHPDQFLNRITFLIQLNKKILQKTKNRLTI